MWKKIAAGAVISVLSLIGASYWLVNASNVEKIANHFLAPEYGLALPQEIKLSWRELQIPALRFYRQSPSLCNALELKHITLNWWQALNQLKIQQALADYQCLTSGNSGDQKTQENLPALLASIPEAELEIEQLSWRNIEAITNPDLQQLLRNPSRISARYLNENLSLQLQNWQQQSLRLQLNAELQQLALQGKISYAPAELQQHWLNFQLQLSPELTDLPNQGQIEYQWQGLDFALPTGELKLAWQDQQGLLQLGDKQQQILNLPISFSPAHVEIKEGQFNWQVPDFQPLRGVLNLRLSPQQTGTFSANLEKSWLPLNANLRVTLLSQGEMGKGALVMEGKGEFNPQDFNLPLSVYGNYKYADMVAYNNFPLSLSGSYQAPSLVFLPSSLLRVTGSSPYFNIQELRFPLAGIRLDRQGLNGRLQAIIKGSTEQLTQIHLHLDGRANNFRAGNASLFDSTANDSQSVLNMIATPALLSDLWRWNFWGNAQVKALNSQLKVSGNGFWQGQDIEINALNGELGKIKLADFSIPSIQLGLNQAIRWQAAQQQLSGALQVQAPQVKFAYGGELLKPNFQLHFNGKNIDDLNIKGALSAGKLGPINIFAHYYQQQLVGNIYWLEQAASVFQSLLPAKWNWLIQHGKIRGQTAFSANDQQGFVAGGHFAIRNGEISLPEGQISGIEFALPYRFRQNALELGLKQPVEVFVRRINKGVQVDNLKVKVQGYYPYSAKRPLKLSQLSLDLLGGQLSINHLALPQQRIANLKLQNIDLEQLVNLMQYNQLTMQGRVNAIFPFWLENKDCLICNGELRQNSALNIKLAPALIAGLQQGGITEKLLANSFDELSFDSLQAQLNLSPTGLLKLKAQLKGKNPSRGKENPLTLNYNHQENVFDLWHNIDYGSQLEQHLEHKINQQLEHHKE